jgi:hypothetical protein
MDNRKFFVLAVMAMSLSFCLPSYAANISGAIKSASNSPAKGASISFTCPGGIVFRGKTDKYGRYRVTGLPNIKWCKLIVSFRKKNSNAARVNSGSGSKDINVRLVANKGVWQLIL